MKRLIVTADDVGLHRALTDGAVDAHLRGIVTACSIVANGAAFDHAVERLRDAPDLSCGVHLTLVEEQPLDGGSESLVGTNGLLHHSWMEFVPRYWAHAIRIDEVERELGLQIERVLEAGIAVRHLNGHQHLHLLPRIFDVVQQLAERHGIPYVRIVDEPRRGFGVRTASVAGLSALGRRARKRARLSTNRRTIGVAAAGRLTKAALVGLLDHVEDRTELVCHPGSSQVALAEAYDWGYGWEEEFQALCDDSVKRAIAERGIDLIVPERCL